MCNSCDCNTEATLKQLNTNANGNSIDKFHHRLHVSAWVLLFVSGGLRKFILSRHKAACNLALRLTKHPTHQSKKQAKLRQAGVGQHRQADGHTRHRVGEPMSLILEYAHRASTAAATATAAAASPPSSQS